RRARHDVRRDRQAARRLRRRVPAEPALHPLAAAPARGHARLRGARHRRRRPARRGHLGRERGGAMTLDELSRSPGRASEAVLYAVAGDAPEAGASLLETMRSRIDEMRDSIRRGLASSEPSRTGMVGWNAKQLHEAPDPLGAPLLKRVQEYAMAVNEENARMGRIVAAPTAGSAGTVPGALLGVADHLGVPDDELVMPLVLAAGVAQVISKRMLTAGPTG